MAGVVSLRLLTWCGIPALWGVSDDKDIRFEWDEAKAASNLRKHGVAFEEAIHVFRDPFRFEETDEFARNEYRFIVIGTVNGTALTVVFTGPEEGVIRIISARGASARERKAYEDSLFHR